MLCGPRTLWSQGELVGKAPLSHRLAQLDKRFVQPLKQVHLITHALACGVFLLMVASALVCRSQPFIRLTRSCPGPSSLQCNAAGNNCPFRLRLKARLWWCCEPRRATPTRVTVGCMATASLSRPLLLQTGHVRHAPHRLAAHKIPSQADAQE